MFICIFDPAMNLMPRCECFGWTASSHYAANDFGVETMFPSCHWVLCKGRNHLVVAQHQDPFHGAQPSTVRITFILYMMLGPGDMISDFPRTSKVYKLTMGSIGPHTIPPKVPTWSCVVSFRSMIARAPFTASSVRSESEDATEACQVAGSQKFITWFQVITTTYIYIYVYYKPMHHILNQQKLHIYYSLIWPNLGDSSFA